MASKYAHKPQTHQIKSEVEEPQTTTEPKHSENAYHIIHQVLRENVATYHHVNASYLVSFCLLVMGCSRCIEQIDQIYSFLDFVHILHLGTT